MKNRLITGILFIVLGILIALGPLSIFPVCGVGEPSDMVMKCHWTARAELGVGILIALLGALLFVFKAASVRRGLSLALGLNGILALLIPTVLIGVCGSAHMTCHSLTLPAAAMTVFPFSTYIGDRLQLPYLQPGAGDIAALLALSLLLSFAVGPLASLVSAVKVSKAETYLTLRAGE